MIKEIKSTLSKVNDIATKYGQLSKLAKKEIDNFLDFLLHKQKEDRAKTMDNYKKKILQTSTWSEDDLKVFLR